MKKIVKMGDGSWMPAFVAALVLTTALSACKKSEPVQSPPSASPAPAASGASVPPNPVPPASVAAPQVAQLPAPTEPAPSAPTATTGVSRAPASAHVKRLPILRSVRSATQAGFDRLVFEFDSTGLPAWQVEYVERPGPDCGSGEPVRVAGAAWLQVRFTGAQGHADRGKESSTARRRKLTQTIARELVRTCDFEGEVSWVIGLMHANSYTPRVMSDPSRLVIDIAH